MQFTPKQLAILQDALETSAAAFRHQIRECLNAGDDISIGFYARELVRIERASHIAWNLSDHFPSN